jgi:type VI secretion system protein ImpA
MSSPDLIDIEALLAPIAGDQPAGSPIPFEIRQQLEEARREEDPDSFAADDPMRPAEFKKADWRGIVQLAQDTLTRTSKDLLTAARLTEALVKEHGFAGLRDGLRLLRGLVEQCWDRLHPEIEDGDIELRAGPFNWLDDPVRGARFPTTLRQVPLLIGPEASYALQHIDRASNNPFRIPQADLDQAIQAASAEQLAALNKDVTECLDELNRLRVILNARMGPAAPGLIEVGKVLEDCRHFLQHALRECPASAVKSDSPSGEKPRTPASSSAPPTTRTEAYRQLAQAAAVLRELEPHSPIPYLVQRAVELGTLPFPLLMKALIRDANVLAEMNRELGIKEQTQEAPEES